MFVAACCVCRLGRMSARLPCDVCVGSFLASCCAPCPCDFRVLYLIYLILHSYTLSCILFCPAPYLCLHFSVVCLHLLVAFHTCWRDTREHIISSSDEMRLSTQAYSHPSPLAFTTHPPFPLLGFSHRSGGILPPTSSEFTVYQAFNQAV